MKRFLPLLLGSLLLSGSLSSIPVLAAPVATGVKLAYPAEPLPVDKCTLFLTTSWAVDPDEIHQILPKAKISYMPNRDDWKQIQVSYDTQIVTLTRQNAPAQVNAQKQTYLELLPELDRDRNLNITRDLGRKAGLLKQMVTVTSLDPDDPDWARLISGLAQLWHATVMYRDEVLDPRLRVLLARQDDWEGGSQIPYFASSLARRQRSEQILLSRKLPILKNLPPIVSEEELVTQSARQVMERAVTLLIVASSTTTLSRVDAGEMLDHWGLIHELSPSEFDYLTVDAPSAEVRQAMNLRFEAAYALLWSLGVVSAPPLPGKPVDLRGMIARIKGKNFNTWFSQARLRPASEILNQLDLVYRLSWAKKQYGSMYYQPLMDLDAALIHEWYYALSWIVGPDNGWDKVRTEFNETGSQAVSKPTLTDPVKTPEKTPDNTETPQ